jgi:hypothetical protein
MAFARAEVGPPLFNAEAVSWTKEQLAELEGVPDVSRVMRYPLNVINEGACAFQRRCRR